MVRKANNNQLGAGEQFGGENNSDLLKDWTVLPCENSWSFESSDSEEGSEEGIYQKEFLDHMLLEAAMTNNPQEVNRLLKQNANPNFKNEQGHTALSSAIPPATQKNSNTQAKNRLDPQKIQNNIYIIETLLKANADPNVEIQGGNRVLHYAAEKHNIQVAKLLLDYKADPDIKNDAGKLPYEYVITYCDYSLAHLLEPKQQSLNRQLLEAVRAKTTDRAQELLKQNANPNIRNQMGKGPLNQAIMNNDSKMVELLIENKANVNTSDSYQPLYLAAINGRDEIVTRLIEKNASIAPQNKNGCTASEGAVMNQHNNTALILQRNLYKQNQRLIPLLQESVKTNDISMVKALIKRGVDVNATIGNSGDTALSIAKTNNNIDIIKLLEQAPSEQKILQQKNQAVINHLLQFTAFHNRIDIVIELIKMGAGINNANIADGNTALHYGVSTNNKELVSLLLQNNADITIKNKQGLTALGVAQDINKQINSHKQNNTDGKQNLESIEEQLSQNIEIIKLLQNDQEQSKITEQKDLEEQKGEENDNTLNNLLAGRLFEKDEMSDTSEEEEEREIKDEATIPIKKVSNKHIHAIKAAAKTEENLATHLEKLQSAINAKQQMDKEQIQDHNIDSAKLEANAALIKQLILELANSTENEAVLNNLLIIATTQADNSTTELLAQNELVNKNFVDQNGCTALHYAAIQGDAEKVETLLQNDFDINITDKYGNTPLHAAVILGKTEVIKLLLEKGAKVNAQDQYGNTAAHFAADAGDKDTIELLQAHKADFTIQDKAGLIALNYAIESIKYTRVKIDSSPQVTQNESSSKDSSNNSSSTSSPQQYFYQKLVNLMNTIKQLTSEAEVIKQLDMKFHQGTEFHTLLQSLEKWLVNDSNYQNHNILQSLDNFLEYCSATIPPAGDLLTIDDLMQPVCE